MWMCYEFMEKMMIIAPILHVYNQVEKHLQESIFLHTSYSSSEVRSHLQIVSLNMTYVLIAGGIDMQISFRPSSEVMIC